MNWLDIVILVILFIALVRGAVSGFLSSVFTLVSLFLAYRFTYVFAKFMQSDLLPFFGIKENWSPIVLTISAFAILFLLFFLVGLVLNKILDRGILATVNHILGAVFSLLLVLIVMSVLFSLTETYILSSKLEDTEHSARVNSRYYYKLCAIGDDILTNKVLVEELEIKVVD